jgi:hypothetical protein
MMAERGPPMRKQLVEARERIVAQLDAIKLRSYGSIYPQDYRGLVAELEQELREIDGLLNDE